jgi:biotin synthase
VENEELLPLEHVVAAARQAKQNGSSRFCMGAAWRSPKDKDIDKVIDMVAAVKAEGLETCLTLGMLTQAQAQRLKTAGLDFYNHNLDTSPDYYPEIISTRTYQDRRDTLAHIREAGMQVCCGGILGMGESRDDRAGLLQELANQQPHPESVPINMLVRVEGTPLADAADFDGIEFVRTIAVARILMPHSYVRLSAGREGMRDETQALCFLAGANSIFYGEKLLTTPNPATDRDKQLFATLGMYAR